MTILFLGNFRSPFCSEVYYRRTLTKMGHTVICLQESEATGQDIIKHERVDYFFWVHTHGWITKEIDEALVTLKERRVPTFGYHLDLYLGLKREPQLHNYVTKVDHFFTVDKIMADWLNANTATKGHFLPAGVFEGECEFGIPDTKKYPHEIIFTGSGHYHQEYPYRGLLIKWLYATYKDKFAHYGSGGFPVIRGTELNNLYASTKVVIGDTLCKDFTYKWYSSDRLFECLGRGAFLIYPRIHGLEMFYQNDREVVFYDYGDFVQLKSLIDYYLVNEEKRNAIRQEGHRRTMEAHTYRHRMQSILDTLNS